MAKLLRGEIVHAPEDFNASSHLKPTKKRGKAEGSDGDVPKKRAKKSETNVQPRAARKPRKKGSILSVQDATNASKSHFISCAL